MKTNYTIRERRVFIKRLKLYFCITLSKESVWSVKHQHLGILSLWLMPATHILWGKKSGEGGGEVSSYKQRAFQLSIWPGLKLVHMLLQCVCSPYQTVWGLLSMPPISMKPTCGKVSHKWQYLLKLLHTVSFDKVWLFYYGLPHWPPRPWLLPATLPDHCVDCSHGCARWWNRCTAKVDWKIRRNTHIWPVYNQHP